MKSEQLTATRYVFLDIEIIEIFNPDDNTWEYYTTGNGTADLNFCIGVMEKDRLCVERLYNDGFFDYLKEV